MRLGVFLPCGLDYHFPMADVYSFPVSEEEIAFIKKTYGPSLALPAPYLVYFARVDTTSIAVYASNKCVIQGSAADEVYGKIKGSKPKKEKAGEFPRYGQIGSDEVGTGDFFGPVIVVGAYVKPSQLPLLKKLGVTDSKLLSDKKILEIGPKLIAEFDYSALTLPNSKYNEVHKTNNLNAIKAKMHNRVLCNLSERHYGAVCCIDQFCPPKAYFKYLVGEDQIIEDPCFSTKGELAFPAVALASVIARYSFLRQMEKLSRKIGAKIPLGAGKEVEEFAKAYAAKKGKAALAEIAKIDFKTYTKI